MRRLGDGLAVLHRVTPARRRAAPPLGTGAEHVGELLGDLGEEPARRVVVGGAEQHPAPRVTQVEPLARPRDPDVAEAPLLLELVGIAEAARVREHAVFHAGEEHHRVLEALRGVQRHQRHRALIAAFPVGVVEIGHQRDRLEERLDAAEPLGDDDLVGVGRVGGPDAGDAGEARDVAGVERDIELAAHADQLLQVLDPAPRFDRTFGLQLGEVPRLLEDRLDRRADPPGGDRFEPEHELEQVADPAERLPAHARVARPRQRVAERDTRTLRVRGDLVDRRVADTPLRRVDDAAPTHFVVGVHQRPQVGEDVLHLTPVVELHSADDAVRHAGPYERLLDHPALRVRAVEDGDVAVPLVLGVDEPTDLVHDERRLVVLVFCVVAGDELATDLLGPEVLRPARRVVGDHRVGGVENALTRPVVLLHHDDRRFREHLLELQEIPKIGPAKFVDRLILVTDHHHVAVLLGEHPHELPLRDVGVLELVDQHVTEARAPPLPRLAVVAEQVHRLHQQVVEVERGGLEEPPLVLAVHVGHPLLRWGEGPVDGLLPRDQLVLHGRDRRVQPPGREALRVHVEVAAHVVDEADGVGLVVDRERRPVPEERGLAAQDARAHRVERRHPHPLRHRTHELRDARLHLAGGLVGERDRGETER